jgi:CHAD domain-containing protein
VIEREVKLGAPADFSLPDLGGVLPGGRVEALPPLKLRATYYDSLDLRLTRAGASLRYRTEDGEGRWTLKLPAGRGGPTLDRRELDFKGPAGQVPPAARRLVTAYLRRAEPVPVAELETRRQRLLLADRAGAKVAEVDDDEVWVIKDSRAVDRFRELEVELAPQASDGVAKAVVERLRAAGALDAGARSKVSRALGPAALGPPDVFVPQVAPHATAGEWGGAVLASGVSRLVDHDPGVRLGEDPEELHQARVAIRRLRSDLRSLHDVFEPGWADALRSELAWAAEPMGATRDADVMIQRLWHDVAMLAPEDAEPASHLLDLLASTRLKLQAEMWQSMETERYVDLLESLVAAWQDPQLGPAAELAAADLAPLLAARAWKRMRKAAKAALALGQGERDADSDSSLHRLRITAKRCRYACEAAALVVGKPARQLARQIARLQDVLGSFQDCVVAEAWLRRMATGPLRLDQAVAVGELIACQRVQAAECRRRWPKVWKAVSDPDLRDWMA